VAPLLPRKARLAAWKSGAKPELLAPAGRIETFFAALAAGADAVYVGAQNFNARLRAANFSMDDIARMTAFAHAQGRRLYVTLNTLVRQDELPELVRTLDALRRIQPDALIVQDLGVYRLARKLAPEMPLHASTQMTIHNLDGALQAQRMGLERVILARELTLDEIRNIRASCTIELETFIHGAHCYSISGQCLFSSYAHGRSANRGRCMQPCRRAFATGNGEAGNEQALFSIRDLNAGPVLEQLIPCGIRSFKIEGRLKPAETIAQTVRAYRLLIDAYPKITAEIIEEAKRCFDRAVGRERSAGFYVSAEPAHILGDPAETQSGRALGEALPGKHGRFGLVPREPVKAGDRLRVQIRPNEAPRGFVVRDLRLEDRVIKRCHAGQRVEIEAPFVVPAGSRVIKAADADAAERGAARLFDRQWAEATARSKTAFAAWLSPGGRNDLVLKVTAGAESFRVNQRQTWAGAIPLQDALRVLRTGSEAFAVRLDVGVGPEMDPEVRVGAAEWEAFRDRALAQLTDALDRQRDAVLEAVCQATNAAPTNETRTMMRLNAFADVEALGDEGAGCDVVLPLRDVENHEFRRFARTSNQRERLMLALPTFQFTTDDRAHAAERIRQALALGLRRFEASNLAHFQLLHATGRRNLFVMTAPGIGCLNAACHAQLRELGADVVTYSIEGDAEGLAGLLRCAPPAQTAVCVYGHAPLFQSRVPAPPDGEYRLQTPRVRVRVERREGIVTVIPAQPFHLRKHVPGLRAQGVYALVYDLTRDPDPLRAMRRALAAEEPEAAASTFNFERHLE